MAKIDDILEKYKKSPLKIFKVTYTITHEETAEITAKSIEEAEKTAKTMFSDIEIKKIEEEN